MSKQNLSLTAAIAIAFVAALAAAVLRREPSGPPPGVQTPASQPVVAGTILGSTSPLAGSASCRPCHERFYQLWAPSHHGLAMQPYSADFARFNLTGQRGDIQIGKHSYRAEITPNQGWLVQRGPSDEKQLPIAHVLGGKNVYYFLTPTERGRLQTLPVAYDVRRKEWFDTAGSGVRHSPGHPDEPLHWTDREYSFNSSCYSCHVSQLSTNYDLKTDSYRTVWAEPGINCETCHGPAGEHVRVCTEAAQGEPPKDLKIITVTQSRGFLADQVDATCAPCHAQMVPLTTSFKPGERYFDHYDLITLEDPDFYPDGRDVGENYTYTLWRMSPCVKTGRIDCLHCHTSSGRFRFKDEPNRSCRPCHAQRVADAAAHTHHPADSEGSLCIRCHMPMTEFARMKRSDHSMLPPTPATTIHFKSPNACNLCHTDKDAVWADKHVRQWHARDYQQPVLHRAGLIAAAREGDWSRLSEMLEYLADRSRDEIVATSLVRLLRSCEDESKWPAMISALEDPSPLVRAAAAEALDGWFSRDSVRALLAAARDEFRLVRIRAAAALAGLPRDELAKGDRKVLAEELKQHEYTTAAFVGAFPLDSRFNLDQGFDYYGDYLDNTTHGGDTGTRDITSVSSERSADRVSEEFLKWYKNLGSEPFFAWVHYFDPHEPYEAPEAYARQYPERPYDAEIAFVDHCLGRILDRVERVGLLERTIVVVTADHGEGLGDHGEDDHGLLTYDSTLRVPLIIRAPEHLGFRGRAFSPAETVDIVPTVLGLADMDFHRDLDGVSLVDVMRGEAAAPRVCYFESLMGKLHFGWSELAGVRCGPWKYIHGSKPELYDITTDPTEQQDLVNAFPEVAELLHKELLVFVAPWVKDERAFCSSTDRETRVRLHSLGYTAAHDGIDVTSICFSGPHPPDQMASYRWLATARRSVHQADWAGAAAAYQSALLVLPTNKDALIGRPVALMMNGEPIRALQEARHAVAVLPDNGEARLVLSMLLLAQGQSSEARKTAEVALSHGAEAVAALMLMGQCAEARGDMIDAEWAYREALARDSGNLHTSLCLCRVLMHTSAGSDVENTLKRAADEHPLIPEAHYNYGVVLLHKNKTREARRCFEKAVELNPSYSNAHHALAVLLHEEGEDEEALHYLQRAIALTTNSAQLAEARTLAAEIRMN